MENKERWFKVTNIDKTAKYYSSSIDRFLYRVGAFYEEYDNETLGIKIDDNFWYFPKKDLEEVHNFTSSEEHVAVIPEGVEDSKEAVDEALGIDRGSHYRYSFRLNLTEEDKEKGFVMVNIDPYRISEVYKLGGWREHLFKKTVRGTDKGHTEQELIEELQCTINRAKQMFEESKE